MDENQLKAVCDPTRLKILALLAEEPLTNTEVYERLQKDGIDYRESIFKALEKLKASGLVKRDHKEKVGYKYSLNFTSLSVGRKLAIVSK